VPKKPRKAFRCLGENRKKPQVAPRPFHGKPGQATPVGVYEFFVFPGSLRPESSQEHLQGSVAGVLRLRTIKPFVRNRSAKRFAQDDESVDELEIVQYSWLDMQEAQKN
jgi:hypothetical protein